LKFRLHVVLVTSTPKLPTSHQFHRKIRTKEMCVNKRSSKKKNLPTGNKSRYNGLCVNRNFITRILNLTIETTVHRTEDDPHRMTSTMKLQR
jgi:hypothetical protein